MTAVTFGRSISDFTPLSAPERRLVEACRIGDAVSFGEAPPHEASLSNAIRGELIRFLALGGDDQAPVHENGINLEGAWVGDPLILDNAQVSVAVTLTHCRFGSVSLNNTRFERSLVLDGSHLDEGLVGAHLRCEGALCLRDGARVIGTVTLADARIGSFLDLSNSQFDSPDTTAIDLHNIRLTGDLLLIRLNAQGQVDLADGQIGGSIYAGGSKIQNAGNVSLFAERSQIGGSIFLTDSFVATGEVRFAAARIGGSLQSLNARFEAEVLAINAENLMLSGWLLFGEGFSAKGSLSLNSARIAGQLKISDAVIDAGEGFTALDIVQATVGGHIDLSGSQIIGRGNMAIDLANSRVAGNVSLDRLQTQGEVALLDCRIDGSLTANGAKLENSGGTSLFAERAQIGGAVFLRDGFRAIGQVRLANTRVGGDLECWDASLEHDGNALSAPHLSVAGSLLCSKLTVKGCFDLTYAQIAGELKISEASIGGDRDAWTLQFEQATIGGGVLFSPGFTCIGGVSLSRCEIGGMLVCSGATIKANVQALNATRLTLQGDLLLDDGVNLRGRTILDFAKIQGSLMCNGRFEYPEGCVVSAFQASVDRQVSMSGGFHALGTVSLRAAVVGGFVDFDGGLVEGFEGVALDLIELRCRSNVFLREGFRAIGSLDFRVAVVGGSIECTGSTFEALGAVCIEAFSSRIGGSVRFDGSFSASGSISLADSRIGGGLHLSGGTFNNPRESALFFAGSSVAYMKTGWQNVAGDVDLSNMRIELLEDDAESWSAFEGALTLDGLTIGRFSDAAPTDSQSRIAWLDQQKIGHLQGDFRPQPWEQVIAVLRAQGHPNAARRVAIAKQVRLRRAGRVPRAERPLHLLYGSLIGYGYRPARLIGILLATWVACAIAYQAASYNRHMFRPTNVALTGEMLDAAYAGFSPLAYSADVLIPVIKLGYKEQWTPVVANSDWWPPWPWLLRLMWWLEAAFGWAAGLLLVGVVANLLKKD